MRGNQCRVVWWTLRRGRIGCYIAWCIGQDIAGLRVIFGLRDPLTFDVLDGVVGTPDGVHDKAEKAYLVL